MCEQVSYQYCLIIAFEFFTEGWNLHACKYRLKKLIFHFLMKKHLIELKCDIIANFQKCRMLCFSLI